MNLSLRVARDHALGRLGVVAILGSALGCAGGQEVTPEAIAHAKEVWTRSGIRDYDLEWAVTGAQNNHFHVRVQAGEVRRVESVQHDGQRSALKPADTRYYSVDGLFLTIANELAQLKTDHPFDQPKGTKVVMRFKPHPSLGYPLWYRRDVMGTAQAIAIDVLKLTSDASTEK
jgi:hypothetical protein